MSHQFRLLAAALLSAASAIAQTCSCGANPPGPPPVRTMAPYASEPEDLRPFSRFTVPYYQHYTKTPEYNGAASIVPTVPAADVSSVDIGFLGPIEAHKDIVLGTAMLRGAQLAIAEANARGGYGGKPFRLKIHNDSAIWGASSNEIVKMVYDEKVWAMLGSISGDTTHIALRVSLRAELPIVNSAATDPTIPETIIPWILTSIQDDRVQCYTLARRIYSDLGLKRIGLLRVNERYGRFGVGKFRDASRRLGHPLVIEQKYMPPDTSFTHQLQVINDSRVDGIVIWGDAAAAGTILKEMRQMGIRTVMITGDNPLTAAAIAAEAGVDDFLAEATPEDKMALIKKEQSGGHLVAMTGDGTNDAPALAQADVGVAMNTGTQAAKEAGNMVDLDSNPTKLIDVIEIGKQLLITRGSLTTFSITNDVAKFFAIIPAMFVSVFPALNSINIMHLSSPHSAILSAVIFNALIIVALIPLALRGVRFRAVGAAAVLRRNLLVYGLGGFIIPFIGIKLIDMIMVGLNLAA